MSTSPPTTPLAPLWAAFAAAAGELTEPTKAAQADVETRGGQRYSYRYLTLPQLSDVVRVTFARHGLAFRQQLTTDDHRVAVVTTLVHTSGACWSSEPLTMHAASRAPQDLGSTMTYARRYQLAALVGLSGSDDDDAAGQTVGHDTPAPASPSRDAPAAGRKPTEKQLKYLHTLLGQHGYGSRESALAYLSGELDRPIESSGDLTAREVSDVIDKIKATPKADRSAVGDEPPADDPWSTEPEPRAWPPVAPTADDAAGEVTLDPPTQAERPGGTVDPPTQAATRRMFATLRGAGLTDRDTTLAWLSDHVGRTLTTSRELTAGEVSSVIDRLTDQQEQQ